MMIASAFSTMSFSFFSHASFAQNAIAPDNTLPINTSVNFNSTNKTYTITGGTQVGANQFHSFQDFSVPTGNTAHFDTAPTTINAIGRVTGSNISNIDGILRTNGTTNLYLVNPNGIVFGANAKLDIAGSFSASTANSIKFSDGSEFNATNPQAPPLLNVNVPLGLQYGNSNAGATISNRGNLSTGQDLVLNADKLDLQGALRSQRDLTLQAQDLVKIRDTSTSPFVATSARDLTIQGNQSIDIFALNNPLTRILSGRNLNLISNGIISGDAHFLSGGNLSFVTTTGAFANFVSNFDPIIYANGDVAFGDYTGAALKVEATGSIQGGNITITSPDTSGAIPVNDPDFITLTTLPSAILRAGVASTFSNIPQAIGGTTFSTAVLAAQSGNISVGNVDTSSTSNAGLIELTATNNITANNLNSSSISENAGNITLTSTNGSININSIIDASTGLNAKNGGNITLESKGDITTNGIRSDGGIDGKSGSISLASSTGSIFINRDINSQNFGSAQKTGGDITFSAPNGSITVDQGVTVTAATADSFENLAGNITLQAGNDINIFGNLIAASNNADISDFTQIFLTSNNGNIILDGAKLSVVNDNPDRFSGDIIIKAAQNVEIKNNSNLIAQGNSGTIQITFGGCNTCETTINQSVLTTENKLNINGLGYNGGINSGGFITIESGLQSNGIVNINSSTLTAEVDGTAFQFGNGIEIAAGMINIDNGKLISSTGGSGNAGFINLATNNLSLISSLISTDTSGSGVGGSITITAPQSVILSGNAKISAETTSSVSSGLGGNIFVNTANLNLTDGSTLSVSTEGEALGGSVKIYTNTLTVDNGNISATTGKITPDATGKGGDISIQPYSRNLLDVIVNNAEAISVSSYGDGIGGVLSFSAPIVTFNGSGDITADARGTQTGGSIIISANQLTINTSLSSEALGGSGDGGDFTIQPYDGQRLDIKLNSLLSVSSNTSGNAGILNIFAPKSITINGNGKITAETLGSGNGGDFILNASESITLSGSGVLSVDARLGSNGNAGNILLDTKDLTLTNGFTISASTDGAGKAGDVSVTASNFTLANGASIQSRTSSSGDSGKIEVIVGNSFILVGTGTGLFADTTSASTGKGGSIFVDPPLVSITNGAGISVNSLGKGNGGNIDIFANKFIFANNAFLRANTASGEGGNINLQIANIFFPRNNSSITATAAGNGNGGNITLSALFLVSLPSENNDIFANAFLGKGGNINITTQGLFGLAFRPRLTILSDITASSEFGLQGNVNLNTPGIDPSKGLNNLPVDLGDASKLITQRCLADRKDSAFIITGRGGIPTSPADVISSDKLQEYMGVTNDSGRIAETRTRVVNPYGEVAIVTGSSQTVLTASWDKQLQSSQDKDVLPDRIVEAQGWTVNPYGEVSLVAEVPNATPATTWTRQLQCR